MRRRFFRRDVLVLVGILVVLAGFTAFLAIRQKQIQDQDQTIIPYSSHSARPDGTLAMYEWLSRLGYHVERIENTAFQISDHTHLLLIIGPSEQIENDEAQYILQWVERGNTLVMADTKSYLDNNLLRKLDVDFNTLDDPTTRIPITQPLADAPIDDLNLETYNSFKFRDSNYVPYAQAEDKTFLARIAHGSGVIWITTLPDLFTNENLRNNNDAQVVAALVAALPRDSTIAFDEYHLGFKPEYAGSFINVLYDTPWGWGVLFTIVLLFGYMAVNGQRLGRVMPIPKALARRSPSEYVTSMANLFRRANKRGMVLQHYRHSLKRRLGRPYHLNPDLPDERYVELLARLRPELDRAELVRVLNSLRRNDTTEADLVKTIEQSVTFGARPTKAR